MSDERTLAVRAALSEGAGAAEKQLALIAGSQGDDQLALVVAELSAPEIVTIVGESDMTKSSLVSAFATPEQFIAVLSRKLDAWSSYYGAMSLNELANSLPGLQDQLEDFLCPMIFAAESADREKEIFEALLDFKIGPELILLTGVGRKDFEEIFVLKENFPSSIGTWQSLFTGLQQRDPAEYQTLQAFYTQHVVDDDHVRAMAECAHEIVQSMSEFRSRDEDSDTVEFVSF
jgi:hypothetical protein